MEKISDIINRLDSPKAGAEPQFKCALCEDVGYIIQGDKVKECSCRKVSELARKRKNAGITPHLSKMQFADFDYSFYTTEQRGKNRSTYRDNARLTVAAAQRFSESIKKGESTEGMLLMGNVGCGKTYLAASIANDLVEHNVDVKFVVVPDFLDELRYTFADTTAAKELELMERVKSASVLILDDLGAHNYTDWSIKTLFSIINYRVNYELPMIVTTNLSVEEIEDLIGSRIYSRLVESCGLYKMRCSYDIRAAMRKRGSSLNKQK